MIARCFIGTTSGADQPDAGIYTCEFDTETGTLSKPTLAAPAASASFVVPHPSGRFLYATRESGDQPAVRAFSIDRASGQLAALNEQSSGGAGPCQVVLDATGRTLMVANYGGGSVAALPVAADGTLGPATAIVKNTGRSTHPQRQDRPYAHFLAADPSNRFALGCDLGTDEILICRLDPVTAALVVSEPRSLQLAGGRGPRHLAFHPDGRHVYVANELANTISVLAWDAATATLTARQEISTLPPGYAAETYVAEIRVHPDGRFLYVSNRGHDSIAIFSIDPTTKLLAAAGHAATGGRWPRHFTIDPSGGWLVVANEQSHDIVVFGIDRTTGSLRQSARITGVSSPSCVVFVR